MGLVESARVESAAAERGEPILFVGTKKQARDVVRREAERCGQYYVTERWLGGMLTNHQTIYKSVQKLDEIEAMMNDGRMENFSKKEQLEFSRKFEKLNTNLGGIRKMKGVPDAVFVVDTAEEETAVREANKLGVPVIGIGAGVDVDGEEDPAVMVIWATDFEVSPGEDCTGPVRLSIHRVDETPHPDSTSLTLTCKDQDTLTVRIYAWDNADSPIAIQPGEVEPHPGPTAAARGRCRPRRGCPGTRPPAAPARGSRAPARP